MTNQEIYVLNSLSGKPLELVAQITAIIPDLIQSVEESGWVKIDDEHQPPQDQLVRIWNDTFQQEMVGKYIGEFTVCADDALFIGDTEYDEKTDKCYWPEGWYLFSEHATDVIYSHCLDIITHFKPLVRPSFLPKIEGDNHG